MTGPKAGVSARHLKSVPMRVLLLALLLGCQQTGSSSSVAAPAGPAPTGASAPTYAKDSPAVVATWEGGSLPYADVQDGLKTQISKMEADYLTQRYEAESGYVEQKVNEAILTAEAKKQGLADSDALLKREVEDKAGTATAAEIEEAFKAVQAKLRGKTMEEARPQLEQMVLRRKQGEIYMAYITTLRESYRVNLQLPYPDLPRILVSADDDPFLGVDNAPIMIVQFAEFQCPYCGKAREATDRVLKDYEGKVKFVFRDFPLGFHDRAIPSAVAANCAGKQGKYWEVHDTFMANQRALAEADLQKAAADAGVDMAAWEICRKDPAMEEEVKKDQADGAAAGVTGTPAFFINGLMISGAQPYEKFKAIIDGELAKAG